MRLLLMLLALLLSLCLGSRMMVEGDSPPDTVVVHEDNPPPEADVDIHVEEDRDPDIVIEQTVPPADPPETP